MNFYKLDDKSSDEKFLNGTPIQCHAVVPLHDYNEGLIKEGDKIVVMLSNGKKYMGSVISVTFSKKDNNAFEGILEIIKHEPPLSVRK